MTGNVVGLRGREIISDRVPREDVIKKLEWLLEAVQSGEVQGVHAVYLFADESTGMIRVGHATSAMLGRIEVMKSRLIADLEKD